VLCRRLNQSQREVSCTVHARAAADARHGCGGAQAGGNETTEKEARLDIMWVMESERVGRIISNSANSCSAARQGEGSECQMFQKHFRVDVRRAPQHRSQRANPAGRVRLWTVGPAKLWGVTRGLWRALTFRMTMIHLANLNLGSDLPI
jgi:hypothetical protein